MHSTDWANAPENLKYRPLDREQTDSLFCTDKPCDGKGERRTDDFTSMATGLRGGRLQSFSTASDFPS
ncbi:MAG: hypothetical protein ACTHLK_10735, partial [Brucella intermedia]